MASTLWLIGFLVGAKTGLVIEAVEEIDGGVTTPPVAGKRTHFISSVAHCLLWTGETFLGRAERTD